MKTRTLFPIPTFRTAMRVLLQTRVVRSLCLLAAVFLLIATADPVPAWGQSPIGKKIYAQHCASCHGENGEGKTQSFSAPLHGDLNLSALTDYIADSMPEEDPDLVVGDDAKAVAEFVFEQFYSEAAQLRISQPRIPLARLTVDQYRNKVADIVGTFASPTWLIEERGITAKYYAARHMTKEREISNQRDDQINYPDAVPHFDPTGKYASVPKPKKKPENQMNQGFSVYWRGGVIAPETGEYHVKVKSKNGFQLFINDERTPLIDRKVRSDDVVDHEAKIFLLAGRNYHFQLDFFSYPDPPAKIQVLWKPPHSPECVIPKSAFTPHGADEVLAIGTDFPADDASAGFERGVGISAQWDQSTTLAAIEAAEWIGNRIERLAKFRLGDADAEAKAKKFCEQLVARSFVTRLSQEDLERYVEKHFSSELSIADKVKRVALVTFKSPRFLYPHLEQREVEFQHATNMALTLWDSGPTHALMTKAERGKLKRLDDRISELYGMTNDPRARQKLNAFFESWLKGHSETLSKDENEFSGFDEQLIADLKTSLALQWNHIAWSEKSDYRELLTADYLFANQRVASFYGLQFAEENRPNEFQKVNSEAAGETQFRSGILTHPYLMADLAYHNESSPIHRGVFVAKRLLGRSLRQPPNNVKPLTEEFAPEMTNRERVEHQTKAPTCMSCHSVINPLGFSLENFDAVGRIRKDEDGKPIDVSSVFKTRRGEDHALNGPKDLAAFLVEDVGAQKNFIRQLFRFYTKNEIAAYGEGQLDRLHERFVGRDFKIRDLLVDIALVVTEHEEKKSNDKQVR